MGQTLLNKKSATDKKFHFAGWSWASINHISLRKLYAQVTTNLRAIQLHEFVTGINMVDVIVSEL